MKKLGNVISNSSPIIGLSMLGLIELLWQLFQQVYVTEAVYDEVVNKGKNNTGAKELAKAVNNNKIKVYKVKDKYLIENFLGKLHKGELEVIAAAKEFNNKPYILLDDKAARYLAERLLLEPTGLIGFLRIAKVYGKIESIKYYLDQLIDNNFRISKKLYLEIIKEDNK